MFRFFAIASLVGVLLGGCPSNPNPDGQSPVSAMITASSTRGTAPLRVSFSGRSSSSTAGGIVAYRWDFAGLASSTAPETFFDFTSPGRYTVSLTVTDSAGNQAVSSVDIRIQGAPPTAVIQSDRSTGNAPLLVRFDGTASSAPDDTIVDYFWNFGDFGESRDSKPAHVYTSNGSFTVTLRVVTGGGVEATTTTTIQVGGVDASLQFNGSQFATLPLGAAVSLGTFTFEAWVKSGDGGTIVSLGDGSVVLSVSPPDNRIRVQVRGASTDISATNLSGSWRHLAITFDSASQVVIYLDGAALGSTIAGDAISLERLLLGQGFRGNLSEVRLWSVVRTPAEIGALRNQRIFAPQSGLLGAWPLNEGTGQTLSNTAGGTSTGGVLGTSTAGEAADPAWSSDAPPALR